MITVLDPYYLHQVISFALSVIATNSLRINFKLLEQRCCVDHDKDMQFLKCNGWLLGAHMTSLYDVLVFS